MNNETMLLLEKQFDTAFAAPDGIQKLRELILTLAMQGKLVPQDPNDQPASELLKAIELEKKRLVKEKRIRVTRLLQEIDLENVPYVLPNGWKWVQLENIAILENGDRSNQYPNETDHQISGIPFFGAKDMVNGVLRFDNGLRFISETKFSKLSKGKLVDKDFVILLRGTVGKIAIFHANAEFSTGFINAQMLIVRMLDKELCDFFGLYSSSNFFQSLVANKITGSAVRQMPANVLLDFIVPLPPIAEQRRIVTKIDQLMARCDELEKLRSDRDQKLITVHTAAIARLLTAKDNDDFSTAWHFNTQHFSELYSVKETVAELRKTILQLAVMGKLVPQDPNDEPASELLAKVADERSKLLNTKEAREEKSLIPISNSEIKDLQIPNGWMAVHLGEVIYCLDYKRKPIKKDDRVKGEIPYYGANGRVGWIDEYIFNEPLVLVVEDETFIGRTLPFSYRIEGKSWVNNHAHVLKPTLAIDIDFLNYSLSYYPFTKLTSGTTGRKKLNKTTLLNIPYIFPPLSEQHRIVAKIDQLMALCDRLEAAIAAAQAKQTDLLNAVMAQV